MDLTEVGIAPGVPGVVLLDGLQHEWYKLEFVRSTYLYRVKVLTEDGIDRFGTVELYLGRNERVQEIAARTVLPDGTEIDASESVLHEDAATGWDVMWDELPF